MKGVIPRIHGHNIFKTFWYLTKFSFHYQWNKAVIITNKPGINELPRDLQNDLRLRILKKLGNTRENSKLK